MTAQIAAYAKKAPPIAVTGGAFTRQRSFYRQDDES